jgi:hypothetical protein
LRLRWSNQMNVVSNLEIDMVLPHVPRRHGTCGC